MSVAQRSRRQAQHRPPTAIEVSILMPCLNEVETLAACIRKALSAIDKDDLAAEVIVADNGSTDGSQDVAEKLGARVVEVAHKGYGSALIGGIEAARGRFVIMGDADDSYDFSALGPLVDKLRQGYDLVMGNRFSGGIAAGAMVWSHRWVGNPVLTFISRVFFRTPVGDMHCGLRGFRKDAIDKLHLRATGMEFASEMVIKASLRRLKIAEVPTRLRPDGRSRPPHLRTWRDGWRHLRFLLMLSPRWLLLYPALVFLTVGLAGLLWLSVGIVHLGPLGLGVHTMLACATLVVVGLQLGGLGLVARTYAARSGLLPPSPWLQRWLTRLTVERGLLLGSLSVLL